jgi:GTP-binding protein
MQEIRNIAIIAHVDHGKTTLVDALLRQSGTHVSKDRPAEQIMDSNDLERERGITIFAKNAAVYWQDLKINIIDTPGHADFGGEVERVLNMADGSLLLIDAQEGPMPQTRFVLKKALAAGHKIIVVINKIDKPNARISYALDKVLELFMELGATNEQLDFPVIYAAGREGKAGMAPDLPAMRDCTPLFEAIRAHIPAPRVEEAAGPFRMMVVAVAHDAYKGKIGIGRVERGAARAGAPIAVIAAHGSVRASKITALMAFKGLERAEAADVAAGDIAAVAGIPDIAIGETIADAEHPDQLPPISIEQPTVKMSFAVNSSPFAGKEGSLCTSRNVRERLFAELERDVALKVREGASADEFIVSGRGELHLSILIETMRREGYELQVSRPEVIMKEIAGRTMEPVEDAWLEAPEEYMGAIIEMMGRRRGELKNMHVENGIASFHFSVPTRGLIGFRSAYIVETKGKGIINALFSGYIPHMGDIEAGRHGSLIASEAGTATTYGLLNAQERGVLFIAPGEKIYEGQVVGQNAKALDMVVNVCRAKQLNNFRAKTEAVSDDLIPAQRMSLEAAIEYIGDDELVEVTPQSIRLRKRILANNLRK